MGLAPSKVEDKPFICSLSRLNGSDGENLRRIMMRYAITGQVARKVANSLVEYDSSVCLRFLRLRFPLSMRSQFERRFKCFCHNLLEEAFRFNRPHIAIELLSRWGFDMKDAGREAISRAVRCEHAKSLRIFRSGRNGTFVTGKELETIGETISSWCFLTDERVAVLKELRRWFRAYSGEDDEDDDSEDDQAREILRLVVQIMEGNKLCRDRDTWAVRNPYAC